MSYNNLKFYRKQKNLLLSELSKITGLSVGYLSHLENGSRSNPSFKTMVKIANALNEKISDVFLN